MTLQQAAARLGELLSADRLTLCTAESCTGGLVADAVTDISGSSAYFLGGVVTYSNAAKAAFLAVPTSYLTSYGAVSAPVAVAMARGGRAAFGADVAVATTGIAGPTGGTRDKPVGLAYVSVVAPGYAACRRFVWPHDRRGNKEAAALAALRLALHWVEARRGQST